MAINWFPGHMARTKREIKENLKLVDAVIEMRDARIIRSSKNPDIDDICGSKPRIILLNKSDLGEENVTRAWIKYLSKENIKVLSVNCSRGLGLKNIKILLNQLLEEKHNRMKKKGISKIVDRAMVVGIPNVGKSSLINKLAKNKIAKVGDKPGVTKNKQWIKTKLGIELMDTPGILWPKLESEETRLNLAYTGAIKDEIVDIEELALNLVNFLGRYYPDRIKSRYKLEGLSEEPLENIQNIARKRGAIISGGEVDYNRVSVLLLDEFRGGKLGPISLERP
ncbi:ribosome biogenesis GTPase YlqF [Clostridium luticellarii]|jgi:ribosome biogenesis GTPase A|uniref:Ribosome biogenesis GTPase A n=1 Tax=Clostridium luticellarii TaxID=1691940 RepID=A0A2T0BR93_9CLOT|nr:ribosome biogenesis GTPase YlqF [Clostridium luticellarii]MCI1943893.1 ribosome biogenesis GTPase YlqF [Clostridium luticellarii]MCI1967154.1 ribosome biogenesis GTPase YlqF [Clostridium luticellarii]MCI1994521.1 ribosome biogenesis GTPase YlqF [Clostridium luticellarii]MCI2038526.1 ribosome biogenesis GTPase YlqF [Clostridium luticellarii]PRR86401.1 Ribosome biogenesis GTPase A [Clostridium luticellarii]